MASNQTPNYGLSQWERSDKVRMEDFNGDNAKIDAGLKAEEEARTAADASLSKALEGKADAATVSKLSQTVAQHTSALSGKGSCQLYASSYTGNGRYGSGRPNSLSFPHKPVVVMVFDVYGFPLIMMQPSMFAVVDERTVNVSWGARSVSWYSTIGESLQLNQDGVSYPVVALLDLDE